MTESTSGLGVGALAAALLLGGCSSKAQSPEAPDGGSGGSPSAPEAGAGGTPHTPAPDASTGGGAPIYDAGPLFGPPLVLEEATGWKEASAPFCTELGGEGTHSSVFADERGVFLLVASQCVLDSYCRKNGTTIYLNPGDGFVPYSVLSEGSGYQSVRLSGFPDGALIAYGDLEVDGEGCQIATFEDGAPRCDLPSSDLEPDDWVLDLFVVDAARAYALTRNQVLEFQGSGWTELARLPEMHTFTSIWGDASRVLLAGFYQSIATIDAATATVTELDGIPAGHYGGIVGVGDGGIFVGNDVGQLFTGDATGLTLRTDVVPDGHSGASFSFARRGASTYFVMSEVFGVWDGAEARLLAYSPIRSFGSPDYYFKDMWALSESDVFLVLDDPRLMQADCGLLSVVWYDGERFRRI